MGIVQDFGGQLIGALVAPILTVQIAERINWHAAFYVAGVLTLIVAPLIATFVKEPPKDDTGDHVISIRRPTVTGPVPR